MLAIRRAGVSGWVAAAVTLPTMATWDDVRRIALELPETSETTSREGQTAWNVKEKGFVWERPLRRADLAALGDAAPEGPILCARVADEGVKQAFLADQPEVYFTTPHFDGFPAVLVRMDEITVADLEELVVEAWLDRAPKRLATKYLALQDHEQSRPD
jgi:hypothetical protein